MKKAISFILCIAVTISLLVPYVFASDDENLIYDTNNEAEFDLSSVSSLNISAPSAILMDSSTGTVLYAKDKDEPLPPASVTKIMTLLLVAEALEKGSINLSDKVSVSDNASSMGGSQIFLKEGEEFTVEELLKSTVIASANDAAVALAEYLCGSENVFVSEMNRRAEELGLKNTRFENATGLDDTVTNHYSSAYDIALMSRELIKHPVILNYSNVWQDSIRNGEFVLTNTNRLVRYYSGCTGLKTGSTDKAGFCVSATAKRGNFHLIAVIMGASTRDERNNDARALLDFGFASYSVYHQPESFLENVDVKKGEKDSVGIIAKDFTALIDKSNEKKIEMRFDIPESLCAPIKKGDVIGTVKYYCGNNEIGKSDILAESDVPLISAFDLFSRIISAVILGKRK